jgi:hypothetical protein
VSENLRIVEKCTLFVHLPGKIPYSSVHFTQLLYCRRDSGVFEEASLVLLEDTMYLPGNARNLRPRCILFICHTVP